MKIAIFTDTYLPQVNGVVTFLEDSTKILAKKHQVVIFAPGSGAYKVEEPAKNITIHWIPSAAFPLYDGYRMASVNIKRVSDLLKEEKPDIVHAHAPVILGLEGIIAAKHAKIPVVITYHTHFPDYVFSIMKGKLPSLFGSLGAYTVKKMIKHVFRMADRVTAPTRELVRELESYGLRNVVYLPNGVEFSKFEKAGNAEIPKILSGKRIVLYAGRVSFEKRIEVLIEAYRKIEADRRDVALVIVGSGPHLHSLKALAKDLGLENIVFAGFVDQDTLSAFYKSAYVFVSASDTETFGLTFIEAMHHGVPVIGVRRFGAKEVIKDGICGILAEPGNPASIASGIEKLLKNRTLRNQMGRNARKRSNEFGIERSVERMIKIYDSAISSHRPVRKKKAQGRKTGVA